MNESSQEHRTRTRTAPDGERDVRHRLGLVLLVIWAVIFCAGAAGELLGIDWLRDLVDFKRFFLR